MTACSPGICNQSCFSALAQRLHLSDELIEQGSAAVDFRSQLNTARRCPGSGHECPPQELSISAVVKCAHPCSFRAIMPECVGKHRRPSVWRLFRRTPPIPGRPVGFPLRILLPQDISLISPSLAFHWNRHFDLGTNIKQTSIFGQGSKKLFALLDLHFSLYSALFSNFTELDLIKSLYRERKP